MIWKPGLRTNQNYKTQSAGKRVRTASDWFCLYFWLVEKMAWELLSNQSTAKKKIRTCQKWPVKLALSNLFTSVKIRRLNFNIMETELQYRYVMISQAFPYLFMVNRIKFVFESFKFAFVAILQFLYSFLGYLWGPINGEPDICEGL